jgi:hypothetical protein
MVQSLGSNWEPSLRSNQLFTPTPDPLYTPSGPSPTPLYPASNPANTFHTTELQSHDHSYTTLRVDQLISNLFITSRKLERRTGLVDIREG